MAAVVTLPFVIAALAAGNQPASDLDDNYDALADAIAEFNTFSNYLVDTGAANAYAVTLPASTTGALSDGLMIQMKVVHVNTGASTLNYNATGAIPIKTSNGGALPPGALPAAAIVVLIYSSSAAAWLLVSAAPYSLFVVQGAVRGLNGANNAGTPNTLYDVAATSVLLADSTGNGTRSGATGTLTNNVGLAGPAINGRDQVGAFSAGSFIHFYFISDGTTLATISSASATAPTLPTNYVYFAYIGAVYFDGSSHLLVTVMRGSKCAYSTKKQLVSTTTNGSEVSTSLAALVPSNALTYDTTFLCSGAPTGAGEAGFLMDYKLVTGAIYTSVSSTADASATGINSYGGVVNEVPYVGGSLIIQGTKVNITTATLVIYINGYRMPNGDS